MHVVKHHLISFVNRFSSSWVIWPTLKPAKSSLIRQWSILGSWMFWWGSADVIALFCKSLRHKTRQSKCLLDNTRSGQKETWHCVTTPDCLQVNNAGKILFKPILECTLDDYRDAFRCLFDAAYIITQRALPQIIANKGKNTFDIDSGPQSSNHIGFVFSTLHRVGVGALQVKKLNTHKQCNLRFLSQVTFQKSNHNLTNQLFFGLSAWQIFASCVLVICFVPGTIINVSSAGVLKPVNPKFSMYYMAKVLLDQYTKALASGKSAACKPWRFDVFCVHIQLKPSSIFSTIHKSNWSVVELGIHGATANAISWVIVWFRFCVDVIP